MKKKLLVLLSSVIAGVGLVGATFAAWAVTDNANPLGINISPNKIDGSTTAYSTMTLSWGETTNFMKVENLQRGVSVTRSIEVVSTFAGIEGDDETGGNLSATLVDNTVGGHTEGAKKLIEEIEIRVYVKNSENKEEDLFTLGGTQTTDREKNADIETESGVARPVYFEILVPEESVTAVQYNTMINDVVYLSIDWNKPSTVTPVHVQRIYYKSDTAPKAYLFTEEAGVIHDNGGFPGQAMTNHNGQYYYIDVNLDEYANVIFSKTGYQTSDISLEDVTATTPYYNGSAWAALPSEAAVEVEYYLVGLFNEWNYDPDYKMVKDEVSGNYSAELTIPANTTVEYKVRSKASGQEDIWYGETAHEGATPNVDWKNDGVSAVTIVVTFNPAKTLEGNTMYIHAALKA